MAKQENRLWRFLSGKGFLWLILASCSAVFLFPFLWMLVSSIKTDEEVSQGEFWPDLPEFRPNSPYVINIDRPARPAGCSAERWKFLLPKFTAIVTQLITQDATRPRLLASDEADEEMVEQAGQFMISRGLKKMPQQVWQETDNAKVETAFQNALKAGNGVQAELIKAYNQTLARLVIHGIKVRARGAGVIYQEKFRSGKQSDPIPEGLKAAPQSSGGLAYDTDGRLVVQSHFAASTDEPLVITRTFTVNRPSKDIYRIIIPFDYDASWHRMHSSVEINGVQYEGTRAVWLAQNRASALTLQLTDNDEEEWGKRPWVPMKKISGEEAPNLQQSEITLTLTLDPSSTSTAGYGKVVRNYERVFLSMPFWKYVINSVLITVLSIFGAVASSCFVAYAFARLKWPGRSLAFLILLSTMMLPPQVTMIPQFLIWRELGWYNTLNPIWVPTWFGVAFFIFLMVQQMKTIPNDLEEAAQIDGMNRLQIWWYVIIPLVKPSMAAIAIMSFMASWNEFMQPLIYLRDMGRFPLSVGIYAMGADDSTSHDMALILAGNLMMTLPVIVIFFFFQRYFIQGVASAGVKG
ncbi:hypothetical protein NT6N_16920 [Oceaniferula spumae]|uniref:ABC transmembrane type-1 domain-containing protein n=1 Tax=Oceaniferula spumae TaxID=2979115 RepID=A0AAT9FKM8_9BACT